MKLYSLKSGGEVRWYISKSYREKGKSTSKIFEKLGTIDDIRKVCGDMDPMDWARERTRILTEADKSDKLMVSVELDPSKDYDSTSRKIFNGGYLYLQMIYYRLGLHEICKEIQGRGRFKFNLNSILSDYVFSKILYPGSRRGTFEDKDSFIESGGYDISDVYRSLSVLAREDTFIQSQLFKNSSKAFGRDTEIIYYDCSNYFFEIEEDDNLRKYGVSKEHRPNPIVQVGIFMDSDGIPLSFCINPGNTNEQVTLIREEKKLVKEFGVKRTIICADAGLSSLGNKNFNSQDGRGFITVQSLKTLSSEYQEWSLSPEGWRLFNPEWEKHDGDERQRRRFGESQETFDLRDETLRSKYHDHLFVKERYVKDDNGFEQRFIVTFSFKYMDYMRHKRSRHIDRALAAISSGKAKKKSKGPNDASRFVTIDHITGDGEVASGVHLSLNKDLIEQEERFDGFYGLATCLTNVAEYVITKNSLRSEIEDLFRISKTDFKARPVYVQREDRIKAHFMICFIALVIFQHLKKEIRVSQGKKPWRRSVKKGEEEELTTSKIRQALVDLNFMKLKGIGYTPAYTGNQVIDALEKYTGICTGKELITLAKMKEIIRMTKKG